MESLQKDSTGRRADTPASPCREKGALLRGAPRRYQRFKAVDERVERKKQAVDGKIAAEHEPLRPEQFAQRAEHVAVRFHAPRLARFAQTGHLHDGIRPRRERRERFAPSMQRAGRAVAWHTRVIDDQHRVGKIARERRRFAQMMPRRLQLEMQAVLRELRVAVAPAAVRHQRVARRGVRVRGFVAHAAHEFEAALRGQHLGDIGGVEPGLRRHRVRQTVLARERRDEARFVERRGRVPFRFHVDGSDHVVSGRVAAIVGRQIVALDGLVVAVAMRHAHARREPRMMSPRERPEVLVRVDDGAVVLRVHVRSAVCVAALAVLALRAWLASGFAPKSISSEPIR